MDLDRYQISILWVKAIKTTWKRPFIMTELEKSGMIPFTRLRHLEGNKHIVVIGDYIKQALEHDRRVLMYQERESV